MTIVNMIACLAVPPVTVLAILIAGHWAAPLPAVAGMAVCVAASGAFAAVWRRDVDVLTDAVRRVASDDPASAEVAESPVVMDRLGREIERLSRRLAARAALQEQRHRADTLILERLPDPVVVLATDRSVRRSNAAARSAFGDDIAAVLRHPGLRGAIDRARPRRTAADG